MELNAAAAYKVLQAHDARFDGRLFVGVVSTGVYCRPVCRVRLPRPENCRYFGTRVQAEAARFRPCLKCRPEIAPGLSQMDSSQALAQAAAQRIESELHRGEQLNVAELAGRMGVTDRHLRRIFLATHGVTPLAYLNTLRLLLAKQLLSDTALPITQVALNSGFASVRRFNAAFSEHYRLNPTQLRKAQTQRAAKLGAVQTPTRLRLAYRPPMDHQALLDFFARRAMPGVEAVEGLCMRRTLRWPHQEQVLTGWLSLVWEPQRQEVHLQLSESLMPASAAVMQQVRQWLDLDAEPERSDAALQRLPLPFVAGTRMPGCMDGFETAVRVILGQQITVMAARTLVHRLLQGFGSPFETPYPDLNRLFPSAAELAVAAPSALGGLGIVRQRVGALQALARAVNSGELSLNRGAAIDHTLQALQALPGIGPWTAQVIAMRALAWPDAWPASDIGLMNALGSRDIKQVMAQAEAWRPWRSYAVARLWRHLETGT